MKVLSVNVSKPGVVEIDGKMVSTGIFKRSVDGPIMLRALDFDGDGQADLRAHGGPHRAVYVYPSEHYGYWPTS
jgi:MOSC domain-containing protein YiiM